MPTSTEQQLSSIFQSEIEETRVLLELLNEEHQLLQQPDPGALKKLTERKQQQIESLEKTVARQIDFLKQQKLPLNRQGIETYLGSIPLDDPIHQQWQLLEQHLENGKRQNEVNGIMLAQSRHQFANALNLLLGFSRGQNTYGSSGESRSTHPSKLLGSA